MARRHGFVNRSNVGDLIGMAVALHRLVETSPLNEGCALSPCSALLLLGCEARVLTSRLPLSGTLGNGRSR